MQDIWITNTEIPISIDTFTGIINLHSISTETQTLPDNLFTYTKNGKKIKHPIEDKIYTLSDFLSILSKIAPNKFGTTQDSSIVIESKNSDPISDITFPPPIKTLLGLDKITTSNIPGGYKLQIGTPINRDLKFIARTPKFVYITCNEVNEYDARGDVLAVLSSKNIENYQFYNPPSRSFKNNYDKKLHIKMKDDFGNEILFKECLIRLIINERLCRENIP